VQPQLKVQHTDNAADRAGVVRNHASPDTHVRLRANTTPNAFPVVVSRLRPCDPNFADKFARRK
jgi:hypothetical protein